jgi:hypothetical protein
MEADRLKDTVRIGKDAIALGEVLKKESLMAMEGKELLSIRQWILFGLGLKIFRAFECLVDDAEKSRSEAMHHLKTITETFIYFKWVAKEPSDLRAKLVNADSVNEKKKYSTKNLDEKFSKEWGKGFVEATKGIETEWEVYRHQKLKDIAQESDMEDWYNRVYSMACDAAHLGDLIEHLPNPNGGYDLYYPQLARYGALLALDNGLSVLFFLMQDISREFQL